MVLPILPILGGAVLIAASIGYFTRKWWIGKKITVLGGRGVGKTTFINYLKNKRIDSNFDQTTLEKYEPMKVEIEGITLYISSGYDVGGSSMQYGEWRKQVENSEILFYILNITKVLNKDVNYIDNIKKDIQAIKKEVEKRQEKIAVFLIANHADEHPDYKNNPTKFEEKVNNQNIIVDSVIQLGGFDYCKIIIGSLKDEEEAKKLIIKILTSYDK